MGGDERLKYLLDTHIWIWSLLEPDRLTKRVKGELVKPENELWLSSISVWELMVLVEKKRIILNSNVETWLKQAFDKAPMKEAPVTFEIAQMSRIVKLPHQDAADRIIAATAVALKLKVISADERMLHSSDFSTLANK